MKTKRKILFVVHQLNYGGVQKAAIAALNAIDYSENEVTLYVRKNRTQLLKDVNKHVSKIIVNEDNTHYYRRPISIYLTLCEMISRWTKNKRMEERVHQQLVRYIVKAQMKKEKKTYFSSGEEYDVAIAYIQGYSSQFVAEHIKAKKKVVFYHVSKDDLHELHERIFPFFDSIVGVNESVKDMLVATYPEVSNKVTYIENYVNAKEIIEKSKVYDIPKINLEVVLCTCGRMSIEKGFDLAVESAKILKEKNLSFHWFFVGDGPDREKIEQLIYKYGLEKHITITGILDNPYPYIVGCDIYVQTSYEESYGLTIKEALILNKRVITTSTMGGKSLIDSDDKGELVECDEKSIANAIMRQLENGQIFKKYYSNAEEQEYLKEIKQYNDKWRRLLEE